jgi:hypothetical protein
VRRHSLADRYLQRCRTIIAHAVAEQLLGLRPLFSRCYRS